MCRAASQPQQQQQFFHARSCPYGQPAIPSPRQLDTRASALCCAHRLRAGTGGQRARLLSSSNPHLARKNILGKCPKFFCLYSHWYEQSVPSLGLESKCCTLNLKLFC